MQAVDIASCESAIQGGGGSVTAEAFIGNGKVTNVIVTNPSSGYITQSCN